MRAKNKSVMSLASRRIPIEASSGNVFADIELPDADELDAKMKLAVKIHRLIAVRRISRHSVASRLHVSQQQIAALKNYRLEGFSVDRLTGFVRALRLSRLLGKSLPRGRRRR